MREYEVEHKTNLAMLRQNAAIGSWMFWELYPETRTDVARLTKAAHSLGLDCNWIPTRSLLLVHRREDHFSRDDLDDNRQARRRRLKKNGS